MKALITGVCGQDGWYLSEFLLRKGYEVHGTVRPTAHVRKSFPGVVLHRVDASDAHATIRLAEDIKPDEIYNLAAITHVLFSFHNPAAVVDSNIHGAINALEAGRRVGAKVYQASTSEMYGILKEQRVNELSPMHPVSPYGISKLAAHGYVKLYRNGYGVFACGGILFNHESPRRCQHAVTQKITNHVAEVALGKDKPLELGNPTAQRDWGHASDYVRAMWMMMQQPVPKDYVIATGIPYTVQDVIDIACETANIPVLKPVSRSYNLRPVDVPYLCGDSTLALEEIGWKPEVPFREIIREMTQAAMERQQA